MKITHLRTDHLTSPLGTRLLAPSLSYVVEASTGKSQQSARIEISDTPDFERLLFDSGRCEAISSLGFVPPIALSPRTRYYWRVSVWADDGDFGVSETAYFETGKRDEPWRASWICAPFEKDVHPVLLRRFELGRVR